MGLCKTFNMHPNILSQANKHISKYVIQCDVNDVLQKLEKSINQCTVRRNPLFSGSLQDFSACFAVWMNPMLCRTVISAQAVQPLGHSKQPLPVLPCVIGNYILSIVCNKKLDCQIQRGFLPQIFANKTHPMPTKGIPLLPMEDLVQF